MISPQRPAEPEAVDQDNHRSIDGARHVESGAVTRASVDYRLSHGELLPKDWHNVIDEQLQ